MGTLHQNLSRLSAIILVVSFTNIADAARNVAGSSDSRSSSSSNFPNADPNTPGRVSEMTPETDRTILTASKDLEFVCRTGGRVKILELEPDANSIVVLWNERQLKLERVATTTGALRFANQAQGIMWLDIPAGGMLLDTKQDRQLASGCLNAKEQSQPSLSKTKSPNSLTDEPLPIAAARTKLEPSLVHNAEPGRLEKPAATDFKYSQSKAEAAAQFAAESVKIDSLVEGSAAVSAPSAVRSGSSFSVFLRVSPEQLAKVMSELKEQYPDNQTVKGRQGVKLTPRMKATVAGFGFEVTSADEAIQAVSSTADTTWMWQVKAVESGLRTLTFSLAGTLNIEGKEVARNFYQYQQKVQVEVSPAGFFEKNWQWIITSLLLPALGAVWAVYRKPKDDTGRPQQSLVDRLRTRRRARAAR